MLTALRCVHIDFCRSVDSWSRSFCGVNLPQGSLQLPGGMCDRLRFLYSTHAPHPVQCHQGHLVSFSSRWKSCCLQIATIGGCNVVTQVYWASCQACWSDPQDMLGNVWPVSQACNGRGWSLCHGPGQGYQMIPHAYNMQELLIFGLPNWQCQPISWLWVLSQLYSSTHQAIVNCDIIAHPISFVHDSP